jgi:hypothetical protein
MTQKLLDLKAYLLTQGHVLTLSTFEDHETICWREDPLSIHIYNEEGLFEAAIFRDDIVRGRCREKDTMSLVDLDIEFRLWKTWIYNG